jgi:adhesin transport system outer membrane protein
MLILALSPSSVEAESLYESVESALKTNPQLQVLVENVQALQYDYKQARGGYLPSVDLLLGYGVEQFSDKVTRSAGAEPSDNDWDTLSKASINLTQLVWDGGKTGSKVSIQEALLDSANYELQAAEQAIALNAVTAHLRVFWKRELVSLAEKNNKIHRDIYQSLMERERAGVGSIADVAQAQSRLSRAESTLYGIQAELQEAVANYRRVVGNAPRDLGYGGAPNTLPPTLEEALQRMEKRNPELLALDKQILESDSKVALSRSNYMPRLNIELASRYNDQLEGDTSWQWTNEAMLFLRWNLFNGGQDVAGVDAALSRKRQSQSGRTARLVELTDATSSTWASYVALGRQKVANRDALDYSRKTFDAYLEQFSVSRRSLLDVLIAENEYFQSAVQLATAEMEETIAAYRILSLMGVLEVPRGSEGLQPSQDYERLKKALVVPTVTKYMSSLPRTPQN